MTSMACSVRRTLKAVPMARILMPPDSTTKARAESFATAKSASPRSRCTRRSSGVNATCTVAPRFNRMVEPSSSVRSSIGVSCAAANDASAEVTGTGPDRFATTSMIAAAAARGTAHQASRRQVRCGRARGASKSGSGTAGTDACRPARRSKFSHARRWRAIASPLHGSAASHCRNSSCSAGERPRSWRITQAAATSAGSRFSEGAGFIAGAAARRRGVGNTRRICGCRWCPAPRRCFPRCRVSGRFPSAKDRRSCAG